MNKYEQLKLENQLCFPLYVCSKEILRKYKPFLSKINLTYTQYLVMMVLWENDKINLKTLGEKLFLDSGTLTPVLIKLEQKGYVKRQKNKIDERNLIVEITKNGSLLKEQAKNIPKSLSQCIPISNEDAYNLYIILNKILKNINIEKDTSLFD